MTAEAAVADGAEAPGGGSGGGRRKLILLAAVPLLIGAAGAGAWFSGLLGGAGRDGAASSAENAAPRQPVFVELPEILTNLNVPGRRPVFVRLRAKLEVPRPEDAVAIQSALPRLMDLFQTYLREMRPEELRGSAGTYRLRQELIARASLVAPPAQVSDILFVEILVQ